MSSSNAIACVTVLCLVTACGGGSSDGTPSSKVSGVAASGAAIAGRIFLKDANGLERYVDTTDGTYSFVVNGLTPPFMLKANWSVNSQPQTLYSIATQPGTANITPLTQVIVMAAAKSTSLDSAYAAPAQNLSNIAAAVPSAVADIQKTLNPLLTSFAQAGVDPITGAFAPDHTGMDALLDSVTVSASGGNISVSNALSGSLILQAPAAHVTNGVAVPDWTDQNALVSYHPDVAVDANGNGLVVWSETVNGKDVIRARFLDGKGTGPVNVSIAGNSVDARLAFDGLGNAIVVWRQYQNSRDTIWSSRYSAAAKTWSAPQQISDLTPIANAAEPVVAMDRAGNAIAVWSEGNGIANHFDVWSARYDAAQNIWAAAAIVSDPTISAYGAQVAINASGHGLVAWVQENDPTNTMNPVDLWARTVTSAGSWGAVTRVNGVAGSSTNWLDAFFALAIDVNGNGGALWVQNAGFTGPSQLNVAMYSAANGWQASSVIPSASGSGFRFPMFAFDGTGNAFAVWRESNPNPPYADVGSAARYAAGIGWGPIVPFTSNSQGNVKDPRLAVDGVGNATIVWYEWQQLASSYAQPVKTIRYLVDTGWGSEILLSPASNLDFVQSICPAPRVGANAVGQTLTIWGYSDNTC
jgi:hypothetical protein